MKQYTRVLARVNLDAVAYNIEMMKKNIHKNTQMMAVIKMDGYGHGAVQIAKLLEPMDYIWGYAVATLDEAILIKDACLKKPVLVLGCIFPDQWDVMIRNEIRMTVYSYEMAKEVSELAEAMGCNVYVHIKLDTGMARLGFQITKENADEIARISKLPNLVMEGMFTHFAKSDEEDKTSAYHQLALFQNFIDRIQTELGLTIPVKHCSNSAAILEMPQANMDMVRAGITTYGLYPSEEVSKDIVPLRAAMSLYSHIVYCKTIHAGQSVSYGGLFTAQKDTRVATIPVGYGDGYPRSLSGKGYVLIRGKKAPILGRVCMDQFMVDISEIPGVMEGDKVTLLGVDGTERITAEELGELSGRFNYEFVCDLGKRIPRVYRQHGEITEVRDYFENF